MKVISIELLEAINTQTDALKVSFDDDSEALMFYHYSDALQFQDKEVIVTFREEYYNGRLWSTVNTLVEAVKIQTVDSAKDFKLFAKEIDNSANIVFADLKDGDNFLSAIMFCTEQKFEASAKARWIELTVRDKNMKYAKMRLFNYDATTLNLAGSYVLCDVTKNAYGFTTSFVQVCDLAPKETEDVVLAETYVLNSIADIPDLIAYNENHNYVETMKSYIEGFKGSVIIKLAMELSQLTCYENCLPDVNFKLVKKAVFLSHSYVLSPASPISKQTLSVIKALSKEIVDNKVVAAMIDYNSATKETETYKTIKKCGEDLMELRYYHD